MAFRIELLPAAHTTLATLPQVWRTRAIEELRAYARASDAVRSPRRLDVPARCCVHVGAWRFTLLIDYALATLRVVALDETPPETPSLKATRSGSLAPAAR
jgi:hypothetical protein